MKIIYTGNNSKEIYENWSLGFERAQFLIGEL